MLNSIDKNASRQLRYTSSIKMKGFTLIEIAIVLIIIGLLVGGILKGNELINSAKAKQLAQDFRSAQAAFYGYQDKYRAIPGDDGNTTRSGVAVSAFGNSNGLIEGTCATDAPRPADGASETQLVWRDFRLGGFVTGDASPNPTVNFYQKNSVGGDICLASNRYTAGAATTPFITAPAATGVSLSGSFVVCSKNIPGDLTARIDTQLDDGLPDKGSIMAIKSTAQFGTPAETTYVPSQTYNLCYGF